MAYLAGLVIVGVFFIVLHYFTELTKPQKLTVTAITLAIILSAIGYNKLNNDKRENMLNVVTSFKQGKTISCSEVKVNDKNYTISIGTFTFIGKENTPNYGKMISALECE